MLQKLFDLWATVGPGVLATLAALLPTIITGLTKYRPASGAIGVLSALLDLLSLVQHKDSPGTLSLPLVRSTPPAPPVQP